MDLCFVFLIVIRLVGYNFISRRIQEIYAVLWELQGLVSQLPMTKTVDQYEDSLPFSSKHGSRSPLTGCGAFYAYRDSQFAQYNEYNNVSM